MFPRDIYVALLVFLLHPTYAKIFMQSYAALGDSYPAGDGVGSPRLFPPVAAICGRFSGAYPVLVANNATLNIQPFEFYNRACGGATTKTVLHHQLANVWGVDLVTIQVGGNEVDFFPVLNECIEQWKPLSTCNRELDRARTAIQSTAFIEAFHGMVGRAKQNAGDRALLLILGYARFFNAKTEQCNHASFSKTNPGNILSNELRQSVNDLVVMLNNVIRSSAEANRATYVDIDEVFEGHRFCEEDVEEPRPDWDGTWFFREKGSRRAVSRKLIVQNSADANDKHQQLAWPNPFKQFADLTRTFHPTENGHIAIAEEIIDTITKLTSTST